MEKKQGFVLEGMEEGSAGSEKRGEKVRGAMPPVEFSGFVVGLAQTALMQLGEIEDPQSGRKLRNLDQARYTIDLLDMLRHKTRGNLDAEEEGLLQRLLVDLRLRYARGA